MNQSTQPPVEVTAEDREAAADIGRYVFFSDLVADGILEGRHSGNDLVQAFARHRIAALNTRAEVGGEAVAWMYAFLGKPRLGVAFSLDQLPNGPGGKGWTETPLYTHPPAPPTSSDPAALRELLARATPGEWSIGHSMERNYIYAGGHHLACIGGSDFGYTIKEDGSPNEADYNAALIVAAINALPALLNELETLRAGEG